MASTQTQPEPPVQASDEQDEPGKRARLAYLLRHSKVWIIALIVLMLAAAVAVASVALFTSQSANAENTSTGGILTQDNSLNGAAILTAEKMVPNEIRTGTVTITNTGDVEGNFSVSHRDLTNYNDADVITTTPPLFSDVQNLTIEDGATVIYDGPIADLGTVQIPGTSVTAWQPGEAHNFTFTIEFVTTGSDDTDNTYQGTKTTVTYVWDAVSTQ